MWPKFSDSGLKIHIDRHENENLGLVIEAKLSSLAGIREDALSGAGFVREEIGDTVLFRLDGRLKFKSSELSSWFVGYDRAAHIDRDADTSFVDVAALRNAHQVTQQARTRMLVKNSAAPKKTLLRGAAILTHPLMKNQWFALPTYGSIHTKMHTQMASRAVSRCGYMTFGARFRRKKIFSVLI